MNDEIREILKILKKCEFGACITKHNSRVLLDYITNLQKENEMLKDNAIHNDKVVDKARWNEMIYKSRIEKAVEYIKLYASYDNNFCLDYHELNNLLKILQNGSDGK